MFVYAHIRRANTIKKVTSPTFQEAIISKSVYECELMRFTIHVEYIQMMSWRGKIHDKEYLKYNPYHITVHRNRGF